MRAFMAEILIIDDDRNLRETMRELLGDAGYLTRTAVNGEEAFALLQMGVPDLTLCDWKMPGVGGEQFLRSLQGEGLLTSMPVVIIDGAWNRPECDAGHAARSLRFRYQAARHGCGAGNRSSRAPPHGAAAGGRVITRAEVPRQVLERGRC